MVGLPSLSAFVWVCVAALALVADVGGLGVDKVFFYFFNKALINRCRSTTLVGRGGDDNDDKVAVVVVSG